MLVPTAHNIIKNKTILSFEREHRYSLRTIYKRIAESFTGLSYADFVSFAYDNTTIDLKLSEIYNRYNE